MEYRLEGGRYSAVATTCAPARRRAGARLAELARAESIPRSRSLSSAGRIAHRDRRLQYLAAPPAHRDSRAVAGSRETCEPAQRSRIWRSRSLVRGRWDADRE